MSGVAEMRVRYGDLFSQSPELQATVVTRIRVGDYVVDEERVTGLIRPGSPSTLHVVVVYRLRAGLIAQVRMLR